MSTGKKPFHIAVSAHEEAPHIAIVEISGYLDAQTVAEFDQALLEDESTPFRSFVIDPAGLLYISSGGIASLMRLVQTARRKDGDVALLRPGEQVHRVLSMLGFADFFYFFKTREEAAAHLRRED